MSKNTKPCPFNETGAHNFTAISYIDVFCTYCGTSLKIDFETIEGPQEPEAVEAPELRPVGECYTVGFTEEPGGETYEMQFFNSPHILNEEGESEPAETRALEFWGHLEQENRVYLERQEMIFIYPERANSLLWSAILRS